MEGKLKDTYWKHGLYGIIYTTTVIEVNILIEGAQLNEDKYKLLFTNQFLNIACHCTIEDI